MTVWLFLVFTAGDVRPMVLREGTGIAFESQARCEQVAAAYNRQSSAAGAATCWPVGVVRK